MTLRLPLLALTLAAALSTPSSSSSRPGSADDSERAELARQIGDAVGRLRAVRDRRRELRAAHGRRVESLRRDIARLRGQLEAISGETGARLEATARLEARVAADKRRLEEIRTKLTRCAQHLLSSAQTIEARIGEGIPYRREERLAELRRIGDDLRSETPLEEAEGLAELWAFLAEEIAALSTTEVWNAAVPLTDEVEKHADVYRLGLVGQGFLTEDGETAGIHRLGATGAGVWSRATTVADVESVRAVVEILRERRAPRLVTVPLDARRRRAGGSPADADADDVKTASSGGEEQP